MQGFQHHHTKTEDIAGGQIVLVPERFGREVARCPGQVMTVPPRIGFGVMRTHQSVVNHATVAVSVDHQVLWLDVAMHITVGVHHRQPGSVLASQFFQLAVRA